MSENIEIKKGVKIEIVNTENTFGNKSFNEIFIGKKCKVLKDEGENILLNNPFISFNKKDLKIL